ncbi:MAG: PorV/PorQ family protein [bacterium]|nr:PorV/PorQ family protein [bacterium]
MKKLKLHLVSIALIFASLGLNSDSGQATGLFPVLGDERAGTTSMTFLKIGVGARAEGLAGAFAPIADDPSCLYWNPAGMVRMRGKSGAIFNFVQWPASLQYSFLGWVHSIDQNSSVGLFAASLSLPEFEETTVTQPHGTGRYVNYGDLLIGASYARSLTDRFSVGLTFKYARETLDDLHMPAYLGDIGTLYFTGLGDIRLGASLQHFGPNLRPGGTYESSSSSGKYQEYPPPTLFRLGAAGSVINTPLHNLIVAVALEHPVDNSENLAFGAEYTYRNIIALRGGRKINRGEESWTAGLGIRIPYRGWQIEFDYAFTDFGRLDLAQRYTSQLFYGGK